MGPYGSSWAARPAPGRTTRRQPGRIPLVRAAHEQARAHERAERGHRAVPAGRVVLVARAQMDLDDRALAVGYHADFGVPPSPGDADGPGAPFFGAPAACWWTFTPVEPMASTRISTPTIRSSCNAVNRRPIATFLDQRLNRWQRWSTCRSAPAGPSTGVPVRHIHSRALTNVWLSTATLPRWRGNRCATLMNRSSVRSYLGVHIRQLSRKT